MRTRTTIQQPQQNSGSCSERPKTVSLAISTTVIITLVIALISVAVLSPSANADIALTAPTTSEASSETASQKPWYNPKGWMKSLGLSGKGADREASSTQKAAIKSEPKEIKTAEASSSEQPENSGWKFWKKPTSSNTEPAKAPKQEIEQKAERAPEQPQYQPTPNTHRGSKTEQSIGAVLETQRGNVVIEFYGKDAPETVANFKKLVEDRFYNSPGMKFHRVVPGFVIQTGDPTGTGYGGSSDKINLEVDNKLSHNEKGVVAMARGPQPNSASSQFYITLSPQKYLDGKYAIFGKVISGFDVLDKIQKDDMLYGVSLKDLSDVTREEPVKTSKGLGKLFGSKTN